MARGAPAAASAASAFYVPYDKIKPLYNVKGEPAKFIWQAFPWLEAFYTNYGACGGGDDRCRCRCRCRCDVVVALAAPSGDQEVDPPTYTHARMHTYMHITELEYAEVPRIQEAIRIRWQIPIVAVAIYALVIFGGRRVMRDREPFDLKNALAVWNGLLAAFSIIGMIRTVPYLFYWLATIGFHDLNCTIPSFTHGERDVGFWCVCVCY